jgi:hypothetical protein
MIIPHDRVSLTVRAEAELILLAATAPATRPDRSPRI